MRLASCCSAATLSPRSAMYAITSAWSACSSRIMSLPAAARRSLAFLLTAATPASSSAVNLVMFSSRAASTSSSTVLSMLKSTFRVWNAAASISDTGNLKLPMSSYRFWISTAAVSCSARRFRRSSSAKDIWLTKSSAELSLAASLAVQSCTRLMKPWYMDAARSGSILDTSSSLAMGEGSSVFCRSTELMRTMPTSLLV
mmetsp:Transcript_4871/g.12373  ORF Transcript_4871/g.12373 Transcript_4871/m.12373 type:complete len:200 (-) Transcript_4871:1607-2206(-)